MRSYNLSTREELMPLAQRRHSRIGMLALLLSCAAVAPARAQTDEQLIRALDSAANAAVIARDTVRLLTFYTPDAVGMYPNTPVARGAPSIIRSYRELFALP